MLRLMQTIRARHPQEIFQGETGRFEVTSPTGEVYEVSARPGANLRIHPVSSINGYQVADDLWLVTKVSDTP